ncbi:PREDICTED: LOC110754803, partial [Prunus dulcis]
MSDDGSRSFWKNFWWREVLGAVGIGLWVWGESLGSLDGLEDEEVRWEERRVRLE